MAHKMTNTNSVPFGTVIQYLGAGTNLPTLEQQGWLLCDGTPVDTKQFPGLFEAIGNTYGSGGIDVFNLPNLQGMFLRSIDPSQNGDVDPDNHSRVDWQGNVVGALVGSRQWHQVVNHSHNWDYNFGHISADGDDLNLPVTTDSPTAGNLGTRQATNTDGGGNETRPVNTYAYFLIYGDPQTTN